MAKKTSARNAPPNVNPEAVAQRAYEIWQREGCPEGRAMEHWFQAEAELAAGRTGTPEVPRPAVTTKAGVSRRSTARLSEKQF